MNKNLALVVAGVIFTLIAVMHLLRIFFKWQIMVNTTVIPIWASSVGFLITITLAIWMFLASRNAY